MQNDLRASALLGDRLSRHARDVLDLLGIRRDPSLTCAPALLRRLLADRGLPVHESALELEERAGGVRLGGTTQLATFAALTRHPELGPGDLLEHEGRRLLPIDGAEIIELWIDEAGTIYRGDRGEGAGDPEEGFCAPLYSGYVTMLERFALQHEPHWSADPRLRAGQRHHVSVWGKAGEAMARALGLPFFAAASDRFGRVWFRNPALIEEIDVPGYRVETSAFLGTPDAATAAARAAREALPEATILRDGKVF